MGTPPPAGWFTSPDDDTAQRWWDGLAWTTFTRPTPAPVEVPAPRPAPAALPVDAAIDARVREASSGRLANTADALVALERQGGLLGAFASVASEALASQQPAALPTGDGVQPYGRPAPQNPFGTDAAGYDAGSGANLAWRLGSHTGGPDPDVVYGSYDGRRRQGNAGPVGTLVLGLAFLVIGLAMAVMLTNHNRTHADESVATGTVVGQHTYVDSKGSTLCSPVAEFRVHGRTFAASSNTSTSHCAAMGSSVPVIYTTAHPGDGYAHVKDTDPLFWLIWLFPVVGAAVTAYAVRNLRAAGRSIPVLVPILRR